MSRLSDALQSGEAVSPAFRTKLDRYADQGGLLGAFTYFFTYLETDDADLASTLASIPTDLFVASALHDDAIDEADEWADRKRRLNEHVSLGDIVFTNVVDAAAEVSSDVDLGPALEVVREIGAGQLAEETFDATASVDEAIARVEARGGVWGELAVELVAVIGRYSDPQLESIRTIATDGLFVLTVFDDLADLPADVANGVTTLPLVCFDGHPEDYPSINALIDTVLESDVPDRLEALVAERRAAIDAAAADLRMSLEQPDEALLEAADRALTWYESICSVPIAETVSPARQRELREGLTGDEPSTRRYIAAHVDELPVAVDPAAVSETVVGLPGDRLARTAIHLSHLEVIVDELMPTTLEDALAELRAASTPPT